MRRHNAMLWCYGVTLGSSLFVGACAHDTYQQRADLIKEHTEAFYTYLKANRVESAIRENEQIEAMASEMGRTVRKRARFLGRKTGAGVRGRSKPNSRSAGMA